jgi:hypothetical protein
MKLHVIHNERKKMQCVFNTLVIRNEALEKSYKGGLIGFLNKHGGECECNGKITVVCYMGSEIYDTMYDLDENGLKYLKDFEFIDAGEYVLIDPERQAYPCNISQRVDWLKGRYVKGYVYVWHDDNEQAKIGC